MWCKLFSTTRQCNRAISYIAPLQRLTAGPPSKIMKMLNIPKHIVQDEVLLLPYTHLERNPGKNTRVRILAAINHWLQIPDDKLETLNEICEIFHNYILLLDDIQDNSVLRRSEPSAHTIYGIPSTMNANNFAAFIGLKKAMECHPQAAEICLETLFEIHRGQGMELYWQENNICPSEEDWRHLVILKAGSIMAAPVRLMLLFSDNRSDYIQLMKDYSVYLQLKDDYTDLTSEDHMEMKHYCADIEEGKLSFPMLHAIQQKGGDKLRYILQQRTKDVEKKKYAMKLIEELGSIQYTLNALKLYDSKVRREIEQHGGNPKLVAIIDEYAYLYKDK